ncbi:hypothetical protein [Cupriavidus taiwanensis]|uniref:hypothetical protein n=1 Tax=Cupriavidus taiwanensis TaxID=164546 RepID=UPI000E1017B8|nr:conserved exported hypothetical protein [Cupriavidus taiwanensis]SOY52891.1 conserved exported hypothetical protein [Cupriavidus taiwanensis]SOY85842.1 conserved exported hypothetical protein [Cupriavidus taiwanensis]SOZ24551.1 conserved exported hypothetical protein [Cupriavidus taiwanensis]SOZ60427.1 conserved exported hypothetical protein [Cupriavidus taiwanensis]
MPRLATIVSVIGTALAGAMAYGFLSGGHDDKLLTAASSAKPFGSSPADANPTIADTAATAAEQSEPADPGRFSSKIRDILENTDLTADEKSDQLWRIFERHAREPETARYLLDSMQFIKPINKKRVIERVEAALHRGTHEDGVKRALINLLAAQFERDAAITAAAEAQLPGNPLVLASLRKAANSGDHATAHQAVLQYSRLGEVQDSLTQLGTARSNGAIDTSEYAREIAFHLPLIKDPVQQQQLLDLMEGCDLPGQELADLLATTAQLPHALSSLAPVALHTIRRILDNNPPAFAVDLLDMDVLALARYNRWAGASSEIAHALSGEPVPDLLANLVMLPDADPRALIAVAVSPMSEPVMQVLTERGLVNEALQRLDRFESAPGDTAVASGIVADIRAKLIRHLLSPISPASALKPVDPLK